MKIEQHTELGKKSSYDSHYNPKKLCCVPRSKNREDIGIHGATLPFYGFDCWNHYEVSWLNSKGKPMVAVAGISYDCSTPYIVESKSLKLYFNSFNDTPFESSQQLAQQIKIDLETRLQGTVEVTIIPLNEITQIAFEPQFQGQCLDDLDISCNTYEVNPHFLSAQGPEVKERLFSNLLKSNCLVTQQPDWGSVLIDYEGQKIHETGLLQYIVSFRHHNEFHEHCIERIFMDIMEQCQPKKLTVYGRYTRRGGLDINPYRSTEPAPSIDSINIRQIRQ